jgi:hypothetical protein
MGWKVRKGGTGPYYYRSVRRGDRVGKEYYGSGILGQVAAQLDEVARLRSQEEAARWKGELELLEQRAEFLREITEAAEILTKAHLVARGFHRRRGEWRRARLEH